ncbi:hypothetical protein ACLOJK_014028 [Asimina triloba]
MILSNSIPFPCPRCKTTRVPAAALRRIMATLFLFPSSTLVPATQSTSPTFHSPKPSFPTLTSIKPKTSALYSARLLPSLSPTPSSSSSSGRRRRRNGGNSRKDFRVRADDDDVDPVSPDDYDMDIEEAEEVDNKKDYDVEYDRLFPSSPTALAESAGGPETGDKIEIEIAQSKSFVSTLGWDSETVVDYKINEDEFHKINLLDCDFFIRKPPDPDSDVYDFREMYVTPPDTDVYAIPKVLAAIPEKVESFYLGGCEWLVDWTATQLGLVSRLLVHAEVKIVWDIWNS